MSLTRVARRRDRDDRHLAADDRAAAAAPCPILAARAAPRSLARAGARALSHAVPPRRRAVAVVLAPGDDDAALTAIIHDPGIEIYAVTDPRGHRDRPARARFPRAGTAASSSFLGLVPELTGKGEGRWLMAQALALGWRKDVDAAVGAHLHARSPARARLLPRAGLRAVRARGRDLRRSAAGRRAAARGGASDPAAGRVRRDLERAVEPRDIDRPQADHAREHDAGRDERQDHRQRRIVPSPSRSAARSRRSGSAAPASRSIAAIRHHDPQRSSRA